MSRSTPRTDRVGLLLDQLADSVEFSRQRLDGLDAQEFVWEPHPDMWSIRPRHEAVSADAFGPGDFVLDRDRSIGPFEPGPLPTIAWRIGHLCSGFAGRHHWTFDEQSTHPDDLVDFTTAPALVDTLWTLIDTWSEHVQRLDDEQLDRVGYSRYPFGLDNDLPFITIVRWMNREAIHHLAEVALLRDLYRYE